MKLYKLHLIFKGILKINRNLSFKSYTSYLNINSEDSNFSQCPSAKLAWHRLFLHYLQADQDSLFKEDTYVPFQDKTSCIEKGWGWLGAGAIAQWRRVMAALPEEEPTWWLTPSITQIPGDPTLTS